jgi:hypothetical protein
MGTLLIFASSHVPMEVVSGGEEAAGMIAVEEALTTSLSPTDVPQYDSPNRKAKDTSSSPLFQ